MKRGVMIKIQPEPIRGKYGVLFRNPHLCPYTVVPSVSSQEHQASLLLAAAKHLTHFELTLSQCM